MPRNLRSHLVIATTFLAAFLLSAVPMPDWAEQFRPDWTALVLIYWCIATPQRIGVGAGWVVGLILDVLYGALLGQHALAKTVIAFLTLKLHLRIRVFPVWQQAFTVLVLLIINHLLVVWVRAIVGEAPHNASFWISNIVGMLVWPWLFVILRDIRRRAHVN